MRPEILSIASEHDNHTTLSLEQLNTLTVYHDNLVALYLDMLGPKLEIRSEDDTNWPMLSYQLIEVLQASDQKAFSHISQKILSEMTGRLSPTNIWLFAAIGLLASSHQTTELQANLIDSFSILPSHLSQMLSTNAVDDRIEALQILKTLLISSELVYGKNLQEYMDVLAREHLSFFRQSPEMLALYAYVLSLSTDNDHWDLINLVLNQLLTSTNSLSLTRRDLRTDALIMCNLLRLSPNPQKVKIAAKHWLISAFDLAMPGTEPEGPPSTFISIRRQYSRDIWLSSWLQASTAAALYLRHTVPLYSSATHPSCAAYCPKSDPL